MNIAFVPARCGSQSIKLKNIKLFCNKPLIYWILKALQDSFSIDIIFVATDCKEIKDTVKSFKFSKVQIYNRSGKNAQSDSTTESVVLEFLENANFNDEDIFFLVQATSPFTQAKDFDNAFELFKKDKADSLLTCVKSKSFYWNTDCTPLNYNIYKRPLRQDFDGNLMENGAFYINSIRNIKKEKNRLSGKIAIYLMEEYQSVEIDEEIDWIIGETLMHKFVLSKDNSF